MSSSRCLRSTSELLETIYRIELPQEEWQREVGRGVLARRTLGAGLLAYEFDASSGDGYVRTGTVVGVGGIEPFRRLTEPIHSRPVGDEYALAVAKGTHAATTRELLAQSEAHEPERSAIIRAIEALGFHDIWAVCSVNPDATGVAFAVPYMQESTPLVGVHREQWTRVGVHVAAACRLRRRLAGGERNGAHACIDSAAGVLSPSGRVHHLEQEAVSDREAIAHFVRALDTGRTREAKGIDEDLLSLWQGLLNGRWSVFDQIDTDGRHYIVVHENDPHATGPTELSPRQRQVATYAAQGHPNKVIAYELGIGTTTVATHLRAALARLRIRRRTDLVWLYGQLVAGRQIAHGDET